MPFTFDKTGFPLLFLPRKALTVHVLPVTRQQVEMFVQSAAASVSPDLRKLVESRTWRAPVAAETGSEQFFATGLLPAEAQAFAAWLGPEYRLPTLREWRAAYLELALGEFALAELNAAMKRPGGPPQGPTPAARETLRRLLTIDNSATLFQFTRFEGGLVEWVRDGDRWVGLGHPRPSFQPNLWNPLVSEVEPVRADERVRYFGFRLFRSYCVAAAKEPTSEADREPRTAT